MDGLEWKDIKSKADKTLIFVICWQQEEEKYKTASLYQDYQIQIWLFF